MKLLQSVAFALWSLLNVGGAAAIALFSGALLHLRYTEMHTSSTAYDPDPNLTRETVVWNVVSQSGQTSLLLLVFVGMFWGLNVSIHEGEAARTYSRMGVRVFCLCALILYSGVALAAIECLNTYPQFGKYSP